MRDYLFLPIILICSVSLYVPMSSMINGAILCSFFTAYKLISTITIMTTATKLQLQ
jgi:hypothetical protein